MREQVKRVLLAASKLGYQTRAFGEVAAKLGVELTLATDRCHLLDDPWRDRALPVKFDDLSGSAAAIEPRFDAVLAVGDRPAELAALLAARQGIAFHPPHAVHAARNKFLARECFAAAELLVPEFSRVPLDAAPPTAAVAFPCVLKPLGLSASRGVIRANNPAEFAAAFKRIQRLLDDPDIRRLHDPADRFIQIEEYIPGREFAIEGLMRAGRLHPLAIFDKPDPLEGPFFEETLYITPSRESAAVQSALIETAQAAAAALGLTDGPVHAELRYNDCGAWPLEIAPRPIGGLCARALVFAPDISLEELILRHALGEDMSGARLAARAAGVMMIPIPQNGGIYRATHGIAGAAITPLIDAIDIAASPGQHFTPLPEGSSYLGFIFAKGPDPAQVEAALRTAHARLRFEFSAVLPVARASTL